MCIRADQVGWWLNKEVRVLPREGDIFGDYVVDEVTYQGSTNMTDKDNVWKNWTCHMKKAVWEGNIFLYQMSRENMSCVYVVKLCRADMSCVYVVQIFQRPRTPARPAQTPRTLMPRKRPRTLMPRQTPQKTKNARAGAKMRPSFGRCCLWPGTTHSKNCKKFRNKPYSACMRCLIQTRDGGQPYLCGVEQATSAVWKRGAPGCTKKKRCPARVGSKFVWRCGSISVDLVPATCWTPPGCHRGKNKECQKEEEEISTIWLWSHTRPTCFVTS